MKWQGMFLLIAATIICSEASARIDICDLTAADPGEAVAFEPTHGVAYTTIEAAQFPILVANTVMTHETLGPGSDEDQWISTEADFIGGGYVRIITVVDPQPGAYAILGSSTGFFLCIVGTGPFGLPLLGLFPGPTTNCNPNPTFVLAV